MPKLLKHAARGDDSPVTAYGNLAEEIAKVASAHELILLSPLLPRDGQWFRMLAFASAATVMTTLTVSLGPAIPTLIEQGLLTTHLRRHFANVQSFDNVKAMARAAREAWPCDIAEALVLTAETKPDFCCYF